MAAIIGATDGIKYGFKLLLYYLVIAILGGAVASFGFGIASAELAVATNDFRQPNILILLTGSVISMVGVSILYAGTLGIGYKVIADAVYTGNVEANKHGASADESKGRSGTTSGAVDGGD